MKRFFFFLSWKVVGNLRREKIWRNLINIRREKKNIVWEVFSASFNIFTLERRIKLDTPFFALSNIIDKGVRIDTFFEYSLFTKMKFQKFGEKFIISSENFYLFYPTYGRRPSTSATRELILAMVGLFVYDSKYWMNHRWWWFSKGINGFTERSHDMWSALFNGGTILSFPFFRLPRRRNVHGLLMFF